MAPLEGAIKKRERVMINREKINFMKENGYHQYPLTMQLEITRDCPFNCPQCYKMELGQKHMDFDLLNRMINEGLQHEVQLFVLNGGEPLLYPDFVNTLKLFRGKDVAVNCFSSGYGLTEEIIQAIKDTPNLSFFISLNGSTKEINDLSRQGYDISIKAIKKLQEHNVPFGINWVARKDNLDDFENMIRFCKENHVSQFSVTSNKLAEKKTAVNSYLKHEDIKRLGDLIKANPDLNITVEACFPQLTAEIRRLKDSDGCAAGYYNINISLEGMFLPCTHLYYPEKWDSLEDYWNNSEMLKKLRKNVVCNNCEKKCRFCKAMSPESYQDFSTGLQYCAKKED